jgi:16S rRNA (guanine966-N2)-methyltransferase
MRGKPKRSTPRRASTGRAPARPAALRIIGGRLRGRRIDYSGDPRTRPMKDRVREAVFNLVRDEIEGRLAIDLFAGTGALGFEAVSRGAARAILIEEHRPTAGMIRKNAERLGILDQLHIIEGDAFEWGKETRITEDDPWLVFCSPPFDFYVQRRDEVLRLLGNLIAKAPPGSAFVVEADQRFDFGWLPEPDRWDIRHYPPAIVGVLRKGGT